jgi:hypothetical protein
VNNCALIWCHFAAEFQGHITPVATGRHVFILIPEMGSGMKLWKAGNNGQRMMQANETAIVVYDSSNNE